MRKLVYLLVFMFSAITYAQTSLEIVGNNLVMEDGSVKRVIQKDKVVAELSNGRLFFLVRDDRGNGVPWGIFRITYGGDKGYAIGDLTEPSGESWATIEDAETWGLENLGKKLSSGGNGGAASSTTYDNTTSGLTAEDVQEALDEIVATGGGIADGAVTEAKLHPDLISEINARGTDASDLTTGQLADARVAESNVTQYEENIKVSQKQVYDYKEPYLLVDPTFSGTSDGSRTAPYTTIADALAHHRANPNSERTIYLRGSHSSITLDNANDEGLTFVLESGASLFGGIEIDYSDVTVPSSTITDRIDAGVRASAREIDLSTVGTSIAEIGDLLYFSSHGPRTSYGTEQGYLSIDDAKLNYSRYPAKGSWLQTGTVSSAGDSGDVTPDDSNGGSFAYSDAEIDSWSNYTDIWSFGFWTHPYAFDKVGIESITGGEITLEKGTWYGITAGTDYYLYNIVERLLNPGDMVVDVANEKIYFIPPTGFGPTSTIKLSTSSDPLIHVDGVDNITIKGTTSWDGEKYVYQSFLEHTRGDAVLVENADNIVVDGFNYGMISSTAVKAEDTSSNVLFINGIAHDIGQSGYELYGGNRLLQQYANNKIVNFKFDRYEVRSRLFGIGNVVQNVTHRDIPLGVLQISGNDLLIKDTEVFNTNQIGDDDGAYYLGRNPTDTGIVFNGGVMDSVGLDQTSTGIQGIYFDDRESNGTVKNFIFRNVGAGVGSAAVKVNQGKYIIMDNNIAMDSERFAYIQVSSVANWQTWYTEQASKIAAVDGTNPDSPWSIAYPSAYSQLSDTEQPPTTTNRITRLGLINTPASQYGLIGASFNHPGAYESDVVSLNYDPFKDSDNGDFRLSENRFNQLFPSLDYIDASKFGFQEDKLFSKSEVEKITVSNLKPTGTLASKNKVENEDVTSISNSKVENLARDLEVIKQWGSSLGLANENYFAETHYTDFDGKGNEEGWVFAGSPGVQAIKNDSILLINDAAGDGSSGRVYYDRKLYGNIQVDFKFDQTGSLLPNHYVGINSTGDKTGDYAVFTRHVNTDRIKFEINNGSGFVYSVSLDENYTDYPYGRITYNEATNKIEFLISEDGVTYDYGIDDALPVEGYTYDLGDEGLYFFVRLDNANAGSQKTIYIDKVSISESVSVENLTNTTVQSTPLIQKTSDTTRINTPIIKDVSGNRIVSENSQGGVTFNNISFGYEAGGYSVYRNGSEIVNKVSTAGGVFLWRTDPSNDFGSYSDIMSLDKTGNLDVTGTISSNGIEYVIKPQPISFTSGRDVVSTDIWNIIECTTSSTLTVPASFTAMEIGDIIYLEAHNTTLTVQGATGVTINGTSEGSASIGDGSSFIGGILRKTGSDSYVVL